MQPSMWHQKVKLIGTSFFLVIFFILLIWLFINNNRIKTSSNFGVTLNLATESIAAFQQNIERLPQLIINNQHQLLASYIDDELPQQQYLFNQVLSQIETDSDTSLFWHRYTILLRKLKVGDSIDLMSNLDARKLVRLLEATSEPGEGITALFQQQQLDNLAQLNSSISISRIIVLLLTVAVTAFTAFSWWCATTQQKIAMKYFSLSQYFSHHQSITLRLSIRGRIKNINDKAKSFLKQQQISKQQLLPNDITEYIKQALMSNNKHTEFELEVSGQLLQCRLTFCKINQQIYLEMVEQKLTEHAIKNDTAGIGHV